MLQTGGGKPSKEFSLLSPHLTFFVSIISFRLQEPTKNPSACPPRDISSKGRFYVGLGHTWAGMARGHHEQIPAEHWRSAVRGVSLQSWAWGCGRRSRGGQGPLEPLRFSARRDTPCDLAQSLHDGKEGSDTNGPSSRVCAGTRVGECQRGLRSWVVLCSSPGPRAPPGIRPRVGRETFFPSGFSSQRLPDPHGLGEGGRGALSIYGLRSSLFRGGS